MFGSPPAKGRKLKGSTQARTNFLEEISLVWDWQGKHYTLEKAGQPGGTRKKGGGEVVYQVVSLGSWFGAHSCTCSRKGQPKTIIVDEEKHSAVSGPLMKATPQSHSTTNLRSVIVNFNGMQPLCAGLEPQEQLLVVQVDQKVC